MSNKTVLTVYQSSHVYTYTKPRKRYLARPPSHVPEQWPQPVARGQGWLYVSTWTSMRLAPVRCCVLLHSLLPTDDACSSSSLSTTVIKFSIFSDPTRKLSALPDSRPNSVEYGNSKTTTLLPSAKCSLMYASTLPRSNWLRRVSIRLAWYRHMPASSSLYSVFNSLWRKNVAELTEMTFQHLGVIRGYW